MPSNFKASGAVLVPLSLLTLGPLHADSKKAELDQKVELMRGLTAEYATAKLPLPRAKKALDFDSSGTYDKAKWDQSLRELGPAARAGDIVQVTGVDIQKDTIVLIINNGINAGKGKWYEHIEVGMGGSTRPVNQRGNSNAPSGTSIAVRFKGTIGDVSAADVKKMLAPVLDFEKHSATEQYFDTLPPEIQAAIKEKKPVEGMDRDQVLLALGRPNRKTRESKDGVELEDWIYGEPPGRVTFVTFSGPKVVKVKDTFAGLGGSIAEAPKAPI
jgi:hypothetical protein